MSKNMSLFSQMLQLFRRDQFAGIVCRHKGERHARGFTCWEQLVSMLFCQLAQAKSLREISGGLASCEGKLRHLGIESPKKSTLAYANEHRSWAIFQELFFVLLDTCKNEARRHKRKFTFKNKLYSIDSSTIDLCHSMYNWAKFRQAKGAVKIHLRLDHDGYLPDYMVVTEGNVHDHQVLKQFTFDKDTITVMDRGYNDYVFFGQMCEKEAFFVTRLKSNAQYETIASHEVNGEGVVSDERIRFTGITAQAKCPHELRKIEFYDAKKERTLIFLTNNKSLEASTIANIYKERWEIESFFKMLKQNLKIKTFVGTSANAVKIQLWTALIAILLLKYLQLKSSFAWSFSNLVALLRMNLFTYRDLWRWINNPFGVVPDATIAWEQMALKL